MNDEVRQILDGTRDYVDRLELEGEALDNSTKNLREWNVRVLGQRQVESDRQEAERKKNLDDENLEWTKLKHWFSNSLYEAILNYTEKHGEELKDIWERAAAVFALPEDTEKIVYHCNLYYECLAILGNLDYTALSDKVHEIRGQAYSDEELVSAHLLFGEQKVRELKDLLYRYESKTFKTANERTTIFNKYSQLKLPMNRVIYTIHKVGEPD